MNSSRQPEISAWGAPLTTKKYYKEIRIGKKLLPIVRGQDYSRCSWSVKRSPPELPKVKEKRRGVSDELVSTKEFVPSPELCREIREYLKQPYTPRRDLKEFRDSIRMAVNKSRTIEELISSTRIPASQKLRSFEAGSSAVVSPLKEFEIGLSPRYGHYRKRRLFSDFLVIRN